MVVFYDLINYVGHANAGLIGHCRWGHLPSKFISPAYAQFSLWSYELEYFLWNLNCSSDFFHLHVQLNISSLDFSPVTFIIYKITKEMW